MKKGFFKGLKLKGSAGSVTVASEVSGRVWVARSLRRGAARVKEHPLLWAAALGLFCTLLQLAVVLALVPGHEGVAARYRTLYAGEIAAYQEVMEGGLTRLTPEKVSPSPEAVSAPKGGLGLKVPPGYPIGAAIVQKALELGAAVTGQAPPDARSALLWTAQLMTWLFWSYVVAFLFRWRVSFTIGGLAVALLMLHPEGLSLVGIGPGALFLAALLGMLFWAAVPGGGLMSALHGAAATSARLFMAVPVVAAGVASVWRRRRRGVVAAIRSFERKAWIFVGALLPLLLYLALMQGRFGAVEGHVKSLGLSAEALAPLKDPVLLWQNVATFVGERTQAAWGGVILLFMSAEFFLLMQEMWLRVESRFRARLPFYLMGAVFFALAVAATGLKLGGEEIAALSATSAGAWDGASFALRQPLGVGFELYLMVVLIFTHILSRVATRTLVGKTVTLFVVGLMVFLQNWAQAGRGLISLLE